MATTRKTAATAARKRVAVEVTQDKARRPRSVLLPEEGEEGSIGMASTYFADPEQKGRLNFVESGCHLLDLVLGGGWVLGRIANIVGDRSAGKTLLAIEATANFARRYPAGLIRYAESESAFDEDYAAALGAPIHRVDFGKAGSFGRVGSDEPMRTVEDWYASLSTFITKCKDAKVPGLYIIDSFDALSDAAEMGREIDQGSFGANKAKKSGELFRKLVDQIEEANILLIVVSQIRDKLNVTFGETKTRSGGRALDFYASHIVWLAEIGKIKKTMQGVERSIGVNVRARCKKNKVGLPFRECDYPIIFGYGVDDLTAGVEWLFEVKADELVREHLDVSKAGYKTRIASLRDKGGEPIREFRRKLNALLSSEWVRIESGFLPKAKKY